MFDLTCFQGAAESFHYQELAGDPLKMELSFTFPLAHVTKLLVLGEGKYSVAVNKFGVLPRRVQNGKCFSPAINRFPLLKFRYLGDFSSDHVSTLDNDTFAIINTQTSSVQGKHLIFLRSFVKKCVLQTLSDVKSTVF